MSNVEDNGTKMTRLFGRERPIHEILGGGKVADVLLWRNKAVSCGIFMGIVSIWFLFQVAEYTLVSFLCNLMITLMLVIFIWSNGARAFNWTPPNLPNILLEESTLYINFCKKLDFFLSKLIHIACGNDIKHFCLAILTISILSTIGNYITTINLLFIGLVCMGTVPFLYEENEEVVDYLFNAFNRRVSTTYEMIDRRVVLKIPRLPLKEKKCN